ncbi:MAG: mechanosensitive ion channel family protein [Candidatus Eremiobacteraeota bacterium]|nr:mechanosensitive ion channel family protein [Candidatus Eremiobacteraeota bacterium]
MLQRRSSASAAVAALALYVLWSGPANAQTLVPPTAVPSTVAGEEQQGLFTTAPIVLDGATLFRVAVPPSASAGTPSIATRVNDIETSLGEVVATTGSGSRQQTTYDPRSLRVHIERTGGVDVLEVVDAQHTDPLPIVTITATDARYNQTTVDALAAEWRGTLDSALVRALLRRQPAVQRRSFAEVTRAAIVLALASVLVWVLRLWLARRIAALTHDVKERTARARAERPSAEPAADGAAVHRRRRRFLAISLRAVQPERRLALWRATAEALLWALALAWFIAATWGFSLFPQTSPLAATLTRATLGVATTIIIVGLLNRALDIVIARIAGAWRAAPFSNAEDRARQLLRIPTIARALGGFKGFVLVFAGGLTVLGQIGVPVGSIFTIGGLAAIGLSLAAQSFVRDFINGFLVLLEDQYVVGDYVTINAYSGIVEALTLRMVQLRDASGELVTIPHSATTAVANQSRNWSRVDYRVPVDPQSDVAKALDVVRNVIEGLAREEAWRDAVLGDIEWIGIEALSKDWAIVRAVVRTAPLRQFALRHAINARVLSAFANAHVALGAQIPGVA